MAEGTRLLEIGTGWGGLAIRAAARGASVTTVTISVEQALLARERIARAGYADRVDVRLQDYRQVTGEYDAVVSVEMVEAVGWNHWPAYFAALDRLLAPGGKVALQAITMPHDRMLATRDTYTWIVKYIFPGGHLPSVQAVHEQVAATSLRITDELRMGSHYAETLRQWRRTFLDRAPEVAELGFDEVFRRMWSLYLAYSEAGFASGYLDVVQFGLGEAHEYGGAAAGALASSALGRRRTASDPRVGRIRSGPGVTRRCCTCARAEPCGDCSGSPGELGIAQAYVTGEIDASADDLAAGLRGLWRLARTGSVTRPRVSPALAGPLCDWARSVDGPRRPGREARLSRRAAHVAARRRGDQPPLRPVERVLRTAAGRVDGLLVRLLRDPLDDHSAMLSAPSSTWSAPSSDSRPASGCSTSGAAGGPSRSTPPSTSASACSVSRSRPSSATMWRS